MRGAGGTPQGQAANVQRWEPADVRAAGPARCQPAPGKGDLAMTNQPETADLCTRLKRCFTLQLCDVFSHALASAISLFTLTIAFCVALRARLGHWTVPVHEILPDSASPSPSNSKMCVHEKKGPCGPDKHTTSEKIKRNILSILTKSRKGGRGQAKGLLSLV